MAQETSSERSDSQLPSISWREARITLQELVISYSALGILILLWLGLHLFRQDEGYVTNLYTEVISIVITVGILNVQAERRAKREREEALKAQLVRDASSVSNEIAKNAIHQIRRHNPEWLIGEEGILKGKDLRLANLQNANLTSANLSNSDLRWANLERTDMRLTKLENANLTEANLKNVGLANANLQGADLSRANLEKAFLDWANMQGATLNNTNFQDARMRIVDLSNADLGYANLHGADLTDANLRGADLRGTKIDETTTLPHGFKYYRGEDLSVFTNPDHPEFWRRSW